jgi:hypothetical protein
MLLTAIVRIPQEGVPDYMVYEARVLPVLAEHGAVLERRLRTADGTTEVHVARFPSQAVLDAYMADPRRDEAQRLFDASGATMEVFMMNDAV